MLALIKITALEPANTPKNNSSQLNTTGMVLARGLDSADRVAEPGGIVSVEERMAAMLRRHPEREDDLPAYTEAAKRMEREIAGRLAMNPNDLVPWLRGMLGQTGR